MSNELAGYVFLMDCKDFNEAQVVRSFLLAQGLHPRIRDEQTRAVAPHFENLLGRLTLEIPGYEFFEASRLLEEHEKPTVVTVTETWETDTKALAKKCLWNSILGLIIVPVICNFYSMSLGYRVLKAEKPLTSQSRRRLFWAVVFNSLSFIVWFTILPKFLRS